MTSSDHSEPLRRRRRAQTAQGEQEWSQDADSSWADYRAEAGKGPATVATTAPASPARTGRRAAPVDARPVPAAPQYEGEGQAERPAAPARDAEPGPLPWWARSGAGPATAPSAPGADLFRSRTETGAAPGEVHPQAPADVAPPWDAALPPVTASPPERSTPPSPEPMRPQHPATPAAGWSVDAAVAAEPAPTAHPIVDPFTPFRLAPSEPGRTPAAFADPAPLPFAAPTVVARPSTVPTSVPLPPAPAPASAPLPAAPASVPFTAPTEHTLAMPRVDSPPPGPGPGPGPAAGRTEPEGVGGMPVSDPDEIPSRRTRSRARTSPPTTTIPVLRPGLPEELISGPIPLPADGPGVPGDEEPSTAATPSRLPAAAPSAASAVTMPAGEAAAPRSRREAKIARTGEIPVTPDPTPVVPAAARGRAGRNLPMAVLVGLVLAGAVIGSLFARKEAFVAVAAVAVVLGLWELAQALRSRSLTIPLVPLAVGSVGMLVSAFVAGPQGLIVAFALTAFGVLLWRILDGVDGAARDVAAGVFAAAYLPLLAGFAALMLAADDGPLRVVTFIAVTVASDLGGYAAGVVFGRHPMAPSVSPKKSWEGFAGSLLACVCVGTATVTLLLSGPWWAGALVGLAAVATATVGDLSESLLKRDLGIKDMSSILPGHGGVMDRLDSLLPTAPVVYLLLSWWVGG